jgi:hypothetical protein
MTLGVSTSQLHGVNLSDFRTAPIRSLPYIPQDFNLTASSAGTQVTIREKEIVQQPTAKKQTAQEAATPKLEMLV